MKLGPGVRVRLKDHGATGKIGKIHISQYVKVDWDSPFEQSLSFLISVHLVVEVQRARVKKNPEQEQLLIQDDQDVFKS